MNTHPMILNNLQKCLLSENFIKLLSIAMIIITVEIPFNSWGSYAVISLFILGIFFGELKNKKQIYLFISFLILFNIIKVFIPQNIIIEKHAIYSPLNTTASFEEPELPDVVDEVGLQKLLSENEYFTKLDKPRKWSFSADSYWNEDAYSRQFDDLNFNNRYDLNVGELNNSSYYVNDSYDLYYPLIFSFKFKKLIADEICWKGILFFPDEKGQYAQKENFKIECIKTNEINIENQTIFGLDLSESTNLSIKLAYDGILKNILHNIQFASILLLLVFNLVLFKYNLASVLTLALSNIFYFAFLFELVGKGLPSKFSSMIYLQRGNDGLTHYKIGRQILENFYNNNYVEVLRGNSDVFYFMPGMRYVNSLFMILFGETMLGYLLIVAFIPFIIIKILRRLINKNWSIIIFWCFMVFPIFESFGFLQFYLSKLAVLGFGESLCYLFLFLFFLLILPKENSSFFTIKNTNFFLCGILFFGVVILRPNYLMQILSFYFAFGFFIFYTYRHGIESEHHNEKLLKFILMVIGFCPILLLLWHNWHFGNEIIFLTKASTIAENLKVPPSIWLDFIFGLSKFQINFVNLKIISANLSTWINYYEIWLMIIYLNLWVGVFRKNNSYFFKIMCFSLICSHIPYLFYAGDHRYTYGLWTICLLIFFRDVKEYYFHKYLIKNFTKFKFDKEFSENFYRFLDPLRR